MIISCSQILIYLSQVDNYRLHGQGSNKDDLRLSIYHYAQRVKCVHVASHSGRMRVLSQSKQLSTNIHLQHDAYISYNHRHFQTQEQVHHLKQQVQNETTLQCTLLRGCDTLPCDQQVQHRMFLNVVHCLFMCHHCKVISITL